MRFWEEEIKKYERRIEKIANDPSSTKLSSNKLLYEIWRDHRRESLAAWDAGEPFVYGRGVAFRILKAMKLHEVSVGFEGDRAGKRANQYLSAARNLGYPDHGCDRIMAGLGIVLSGDLPKPAVTITSNYPCDPENQASLIASNVFGVPSIGVDIPSQSDDKALRYVVTQLEDMIKQIEHYVPSARYSEARLIEYQALWRRQHKALKDIYRLKAAVPCPVAGSDSFRLPPFGIVDDPRVAQYAEMYRDELAKRVSKGFGAVQGERLRFAWLISGPVYVDPWTFLAKQGVSVPFFEFGLAAYAFGFSQSDPWQEASEKGELSPLEEEARASLVNSWSGPAERRVRDLLKACTDLKIDGIVHYQIWGCPNLIASSQMVADRAKSELGLPSILIQGAALDSERLPGSELESKLTDFIDVCSANKKR